MNKTKNLFAAAILFPLLNCSLRAETALEQFEALGPVTELALPQPAAQNAQKAGLSPAEARKKLPLFDYLKSDVLSVKRNTPVVHHKYSVETIELLVKDPLRQLGEFKQEYMLPHLGFYERMCNLSEKWLKFSVDKKKEAELQESINITHLSITPMGAVSFSYTAPIFIFLLGAFPFFLIFQSMFFVLFFLILAAGLIKPFAKIPMFIANRWRMKASNQMVLCIFYAVTYMRHTSNLEKAIEFAADHLSPPLSLDLKKVLWDVETERYSTLKESLDFYLESWKKWNGEFIEAFHLIESSLYEGDEARRLGSLDKGLDIILDETFEKMLHYAHNLKSPITMLHMLGVILPILGLVILPLVVSFMENVNPLHIAMLYNVALPISVYYIGKNVLSKRPTGYGDTDIAEENPELKKYRNIIIKIGNQELQVTPLIISVFVGVILR